MQLSTVQARDFADEAVSVFRDELRKCFRYTGELSLFQWEPVRHYPHQLVAHIDYDFPPCRRKSYGHKRAYLFSVVHLSGHGRLDTRKLRKYSMISARSLVLKRYGEVIAEMNQAIRGRHPHLLKPKYCLPPA